MHIISAKKIGGLGEAAVGQAVENPLGTPNAPGVSGSWLDRTADARCVRILVAWQLATHCFQKGVFLG